MSYIPDNTEHDVSVEDLLKVIINKLDILIRHNECLNDEIFTEEDLEDDDN